MDAPDVAMTEVALGSCLSNCIILNLIKITGDNDNNTQSKLKLLFASIISIILISILTYYCLNLPEYGSLNTNPLLPTSNKLPTEAKSPTKF